MTLLLMLQRKFFRRFMDGRSGPWGALAAGIFGFRMLVRWSRKSEDVTYRTVLKPGETVTIAHSTDTEVSVKRSKRKQRRIDEQHARVAKKERRGRKGRRARRASKQAASKQAASKQAASTVAGESSAT